MTSSTIHTCHTVPHPSLTAHAILSKVWRGRLLAVMAVALCVMMAGCRRGSQVPSDEWQRRLAVVDDSLTQRSPLSRILIEKGLRQATDSLAYYEYAVRMAKWYALSPTPDSMGLFLRPAMRFLQRQQPSERRDILLAHAYCCQALPLHNFHQQPDSVTAFYTRAYHLFLNTSQQKVLPALCGNLADAYYFKDNLPEAASWYRRALFLVDSLGLPRSQDITLYLGLARIYMNLNDFATSRKYYEQTERHFSEMQPSMQAYFLNDYGSYFYYSKDYEASLGKFLQLQDMLKRNGMEQNFDMYLCRLNLADVYLNLGRLDEARRHLIMVEPYMRRMNDPVATYYVNTIKIGLALRRGDMATVSRILADEPRLFKPMYNMEHIRNQYLQQYYERTGNYRMAYNLSVADRHLTDSMNSSRSNMRATEILDRFTQDTLRLHHDLAMQQKNAYIYRTNTWLTGAAMLACLLAVSLALWMVHSRRQQLKSRMDIMQLKLASARNRINPHFVFNVLNNNIASARSQAADTSVADRLQTLARLIRANLDMSVRMTVPLSDELAFVRRYIEVERPMLGPSFACHVSVAPDVRPDEVQVPSMFLQILAENALVHGLKGWEGDKCLDIDARRTEDGTFITITDNGRGFDIRSTMPKKRTGLSIITQTVAVVNEHSKSKMRFTLRNMTDADGRVCGCQSVLVIPDGVLQALS